MTDWEPVEGRPGVTVKLAENRVGRLVVTACKIEAPAVTAELLRAIPLARIEREANAKRHASKPATDLPPLRRQAGQTPEAFSRLVATHFSEVSRTVANPAAVLAETWGIKLPTVHTWIREARLRGFLPPTARKKAG